MIDHTGVLVDASQASAVLQWYESTLVPLGYKKRFTEGPNEEAAGFSDADVGADFWIITIDKTPNITLHVAFRAKDHETVDAFHAAGLQAGGKCNGPPGERPHFGEGYYAAFVLDPAGNNVEVLYRPSFN